MAARVCGYCDVQAHLTLRLREIAHLSGARVLIRAVYECDHCHNFSVARLLTSGLRDYGDVQVDAAIGRGDPTWVPQHVEGREYPDVPEQIASTADEAYRSGSINARRGSILLARTAIEATAKDKGIDSGNLKSKIDALAAAGHIRANIATAAHQVRLAGNDMAHGDLGVTPDDEDVEQMLRLMDLVLREVYETPALIDTVTSKREGAAPNAAPEGDDRDGDVQRGSVHYG